MDKKEEQVQEQKQEEGDKKDMINGLVDEEAEMELAWKERSKRRKKERGCGFWQGGTEGRGVREGWRGNRVKARS